MRQLSILGLYAMLNSYVLGAESQHGSEKWVGFTEHQVEFNTDVLSASDLTLSDGSITYRASNGNYELGLSLNHGYMDLDYRPNPVADLIGQSRDLSRNRIGGQLYLNIPISKKIEWRLGAGFYDGYTNFRSLWLNE